MKPTIGAWMVSIGLVGSSSWQHAAAVEAFFSDGVHQTQACLDQQQWLTSNWKLRGILLTQEAGWAFLLNHEQWNVLQVGDALGPHARLEAIELESVRIKLEGCPSYRLNLATPH